jgi:shikimate dehydrogenase
LACQKALEDLGGDVIKVSREPRDKKMISYQELEKMKSLEIVVNTTPVGMYPNVLSSPLDKNTAKKANVIIDIIFNPKKTLLMSYNNKSHNGLRMLLMQAVKAEDIWLDKEYNIDYNEYFMRLKEMI